MRQNRSTISSKGQRHKVTQINLLKDDLMSKINGFQDTKNNFKPQTPQKVPKYNVCSQFDDLQLISFDKSQNLTPIEKPKSILQKAKEITRSNRQRIESAKKAYKKSNLQNQGMFLTGCGLYKAEDKQQQVTGDFQSLDLNDALKFLVSHQKDDLQELRRMINKASSDIKQYSEEVTKTTSEVQNAADLFGKSFNTDLRVKVNRCKPVQKELSRLVLSEDQVKRKISTSGKSRAKNIY